MENQTIDTSVATTRDYVLLHNDIATGRGDFSACMLDILFFILANLKEDETKYIVNAKDIEHITGRQWNYQQFREATEVLGSRMFEIQMKGRFRQLWLFSCVDYIEGTGSFEVSLGQKALPYLFDLKENFSEVQLKSILGASSKYAKRIYMMCCRYRHLKKKSDVMTIASLKEMLGLKDPKGKKKEQYQKISQFREKVLDVAKMQINEHTDIQFEYTLRKKGRSFHWIEIFINSKASKQLEINFKISIEDNKLYSHIKKSGINNAEHIEFIAKQGRQTFENIKQSALNKLMNERNKKVQSTEDVCELIIAKYRQLNKDM